MIPISITHFSIVLDGKLFIGDFVWPTIEGKK